MDIQTINRAIIGGKWTNQDLESMIDAVKFARSQLATKMKFSLIKGAKVKWHSPKQGRMVEGTISKLAVKYATVSTPQGMWKVPMNMLQLVG